MQLGLDRRAPVIVEGWARDLSEFREPRAKAGRSSRVSHDVFLCYATENSEAVNALCNALEREGVQCWMAPH
jgi:hypothetical protein